MSGFWKKGMALERDGGSERRIWRGSVVAVGLDDEVVGTLD